MAINISKKRKSILTPRERQVLAMAARGLTIAEMSEELVTSVCTIKSFLHNACHKLNARNRGHATIIALKRGLLNDQDIYTAEEMVDMWAPLGPDVFEQVAVILRQRSGQDLSQCV